ncbi:hypothetical protein JOB34_00225, partial [Allobranchiibius sp. GilTou38]|nr:hypothetical protein [Allobranchiibius sp. GilTou38]
GPASPDRVPQWPRRKTLKESPMPRFMDVHSIDGGVRVEDVAKAHAADRMREVPDHVVRDFSCVKWS